MATVIQPVDNASDPPLKARSSATLVSRFVCASEFHYGYTSNLNGERTQDFVDSMAAYGGVQRFFCLGDIIELADPTYVLSKAILDSSGLPYSVTAGNHDNAANMKTAWGMSQLYYNVTVGDIVWILLDASVSGTAINATQMAYLNNTLNYYSTKLAFVLMHVGQVKLTWPALEAQNEAFKLIVQYHADHIGGVIMGHTHNYNLMTYEINSVRYSYDGVVGSNYTVLWDGYYDYMVVDVYDTGGTYTVNLKDVNVATLEPIYGTTATYTPDSGLSPVWIAAAEPALASNGANWLNGLPAANKTCIFNGSSVRNCTWNLNVSNNLYMMVGFTGKVNVSSAVTFHDVFVTGGTFNASGRTRINGSLSIWNNGMLPGQGYTGTMPNNYARFIFNGNYSKWQTPTNTPYLKELIIEGGVRQQLSAYMPAIGVGYNVTGTHVIARTIQFIIIPCNLARISGSVVGEGTNTTQGLLNFYASWTNPTIPVFTGTLDCQLRLRGDPVNAVFTLAGPLNIGGILTIRRSSDTAGAQIITLNSANYSVSCGGLMVWVGGYWNAKRSNITCSGNWDSENGTFLANESTVYLTGSNRYARLNHSQNFTNLVVNATNIRVISDVQNTISIQGTTAEVQITPTGGNVSVCLGYPVLPTDYANWSMSIRANASGSVIMNVTIMGLQPATTYSCTMNGTVLARSTVGTNRMFQFGFDGPWSEHDFIILALPPSDDGGGGGVHLTAKFSYTISGATVQFTDESTPGGFGAAISDWRWDFGDGEDSALPDPKHKYSDPGTYIVTLTVTDDAGLSAATSQVVYVAEGGGVGLLSQLAGLVPVIVALIVALAVVAVTRRPSGVVIAVIIIIAGVVVYLKVW